MRIDPALFEENERTAPVQDERQFLITGPYRCEVGGELPQVTIAYETWGELNEDRSNAVLVCHALTGDAQEVAALNQLVHYIHSPTFPGGYGEVGAQALTSPSALDQSVTISAGSNNGVRDEDVVVMNGTMGRPASRIRRLATSLSIATAEPVTADPTNGTSASDPAG